MDRIKNELPVDDREMAVENARAMRRLLENDDFTHLFQEIYIEAFAITNAHNSWAYTEETMQRFGEKTKARGHFSKFIDDIITDGENAYASLQEDEDEEL